MNNSNNSKDMLIQIGELVFTEMEGIKDISYNTDENDSANSFALAMDDEREFIISVQEKANKRNE